MGYIEFKTNRNIYILEQTEDWTIRRLGRNEDQTKELIEIMPNRGGRYAWNYISKEAIEDWDEEYPDGYELWVDDIYMTTVNGLQMYALEQISTIQYYLMNGYELTDITYSKEDSTEGRSSPISLIASFVASAGNTRLPETV